jgi:acetyltransferase-like isoleucine patch superfamily enzyme
MNNKCTLVSEGEGIEVGEYTLFGTRVEIYDSDFHYLKNLRSMCGVPATAPVVIGRNVFVRSSVRILNGVTIGDYYVIGNGSLGISSISAGVVAAGNPARIIRGLKQKPKRDQIEILSK